MNSVRDVALSKDFLNSSVSFLFAFDFVGSGDVSVTESAAAKSNALVGFTTGCAGNSSEGFSNVG